MFQVSATSGTTNVLLFVGYTEADWDDLRIQYGHHAHAHALGLGGDDEVDLTEVPLRMTLVGGEGASPTVRRQVASAFGPDLRWQELYGSTETAGPILPTLPANGRPTYGPPCLE